MPRYKSSTREAKSPEEKRARDLFFSILDIIQTFSNDIESINKEFNVFVSKFKITFKLLKDHFECTFIQSNSSFVIQLTNQSPKNSVICRKISSSGRLKLWMYELKIPIQNICCIIWTEKSNLDHDPLFSRNELLSSGNTFDTN